MHLFILLVAFNKTKVIFMSKSNKENKKLQEVMTMTCDVHNKHIAVASLCAFCLSY